jgi:hypothetical protein
MEADDENKITRTKEIKITEMKGLQKRKEAVSSVIGLTT